MKTLLIAIFLLGLRAYADDLIVRVAEKESSEAPVNFRVNEASLHASRTRSAANRALPAIQKYSIANRQLSAGGRLPTAADEILFQTTVDGADFILVRDEYNSWYGPLKLILYLGGHPVQISKIAIVKVSSGRLVRKELLRREAAYRWIASIAK